MQKFLDCNTSQMMFGFNYGINGSYSKDGFPVWTPKISGISCFGMNLYYDSGKSSLYCNVNMMSLINKLVNPTEKVKIVTDNISCFNLKNETNLQHSQYYSFVYPFFKVENKSGVFYDIADDLYFNKLTNSVVGFSDSFQYEIQLQMFYVDILNKDNNVITNVEKAVLLPIIMKAEQVHIIKNGEFGGSGLSGRNLSDGNSPIDVDCSFSVDRGRNESNQHTVQIKKTPMYCKDTLRYVDPNYEYWHCIEEDGKTIKKLEVLDNFKITNFTCTYPGAFYTMTLGNKGLNVVIAFGRAYLNNIKTNGLHSFEFEAEDVEHEGELKTYTGSFTVEGMMENETETMQTYHYIVKDSAGDLYSGSFWQDIPVPVYVSDYWFLNDDGKKCNYENIYLEIVKYECSSSITVLIKDYVLGTILETESISVDGSYPFSNEKIKGVVVIEGFPVNKTINVKGSCAQLSFKFEESQGNLFIKGYDNELIAKDLYHEPVCSIGPIDLNNIQDTYALIFNIPTFSTDYNYNINEFYGDCKVIDKKIFNIYAVYRNNVQCDLSNKFTLCPEPPYQYVFSGNDILSGSYLWNVYYLSGGVCNCPEVSPSSLQTLATITDIFDSEGSLVPDMDLRLLPILTYQPQSIEVIESYEDSGADDFVGIGEFKTITKISTELYKIEYYYDYLKQRKIREEDLDIQNCDSKDETGDDLIGCTCQNCESGDVLTNVDIAETNILCEKTKYNEYEPESFAKTNMFLNGQESQYREEATWGWHGGGTFEMNGSCVGYLWGCTRPPAVVSGVAGWGGGCQYVVYEPVCWAHFFNVPPCNARVYDFDCSSQDGYYYYLEPCGVEGQWNYCTYSSCTLACGINVAFR